MLVDYEGKRFMKKGFKIALISIFFLLSLVIGAEIVFAAQNSVYASEDNEVIVLPSSYCLRDEYFIQTTNQHGQGLCWNFASSMAFTTTVMKSTNQYIDYSEGWVSNYIAATSTYYLPGDGGSYSGYANAIASAGVIQEQDFNLQ